MITYEEILLKGFVFEHIDISKELEKDIWAQQFTISDSKSSVSYFIKQLDSNLSKVIAKLICQKTTDIFLLDLISKFNFDANKMIKGDFMELHNEVSQKSPIEVIVWLPKENSFEGRDFLMEMEQGVQTFHPKKGSVCFLDTTSLINRHGVSPLLSDTEIISIVGGLGRKV